MGFKADLTVPPQIRAKPAADDRALSMREKLVGTRLQTYMPSSAGLLAAVAAVLISCACAGAQQNSLDVGQSWPDRRPMGRVILSDGSNSTSSNLNGWNDGGPNALGVPGFQADILGRINNAIYYTRQMHGQGIIIWDITGCGRTNLNLGNAQYLGDPRFLAPASAGLTTNTSYSPYVPPNSTLGLNGIEPSVNAIADQAFAAIRSAGLVPGICIRGQKVAMSGGDIVNPFSSTNLNNQLYYDTVSNQLADLDAKLIYAYNRWGCRIFYVDSDTASTDVLPLLQNQGDSTFSPAYVFAQLQLRHPDCLCIPELIFDGAFTDASLGINDPAYRYLKVAARYTSFIPASAMSPFLSSSELIAVPDAFTLIACANLGTSDPADTPNVIYALQHNQCILMAEAWYNSSGITLIINWQTSAGVNGFKKFRRKSHRHQPDSASPHRDQTVALRQETFCSQRNSRWQVSRLPSSG